MNHSKEDSTHYREPSPQEPYSEGEPSPPPGPRATPSSPPPVWGRSEYYRDDSRHKSPALATLLSLMPGLGQTYVGYYQQGFINVLVVGSLITLLASDIGTLSPLAAFFLAFYWLYNLIDAGRKANFYNEAISGLRPAELPEDFDSPDSKGSLLIGIILIALGTIAFLNTMFDISLRWLNDWWPVAPILLGAYLIYKAVMNGKDQ